MILGIVVYYAAQFGWIPGLHPTIIAAPLYLALPVSIVCMVVLTQITKNTSTHGNMDAYFSDLWENSPNNWEKHPEILDRMPA
jgi:hypothetical protein